MGITEGDRNYNQKNFDRDGKYYLVQALVITLAGFFILTFMVIYTRLHQEPLPGEETIPQTSVQCEVLGCTAKVFAPKDFDKLVSFTAVREFSDEKDRWLVRAVLEYVDAKHVAREGLWYYDGDHVAERATHLYRINLYTLDGWPVASAPVEGKDD